MRYKKDLISVIIPVYNRPDSLRETLNSVINQTYSDLEILIVDDGSETEIGPVIKEFEDSRIHYYKIKHENANVARNYGIENSKGKYIAMLDADDLWLKDHIESSLAKLKESKCDGVYSSLILKGSMNQHIQQVIVRPLNKNETMIDYLLSTVYGAQTSTLLMTAESAENILWNPTLNRHQDYDFVVRYNKRYKLTAKKEPTVVYPLRESRQVIIDFKSCIQVIKENQNDISPNIYMRYHYNMLSLAKHKNASLEIIEHYKKEATYYKEFISLYQFLMIRQPKTKEEQLKFKEEYVSYISEIEPV